ncbi:hypothetical protein [Streptomyces sp. NRRL F-5135]|uniref:hypothetical protein n=1 Tax=Streptomyces sp. NRRL F-5135 TaxID=1463858 RepID=UPI0004C57BD0|nr:hypothetical protein [Streptomyces sp. NRRL F-5135]
MTGTLNDLSAPLLALRLLAVEFAHLPAPSVSVSTVYPDLLHLSFHDGGFASFEAWREALEIDPAEVVHHVQGDGRTGVLDVHGVFAGARLRLTGYTRIASGTGVPADAGAVS